MKGKSNHSLVYLIAESFREILEISSIKSDGLLISEVLGLTSFCLMMLMSIARLSPHVFYKLPQNLST